MFSTKSLLAAALCGCLLFPCAVPASEGNYVLSSSTLIDEESCLFRINDISVDEFWGVMLNVTCENRTSDHVQMFFISSASVDSYLIDPIWSYEVQPGSSGESSIAFNIQEMEKYGILSADEITFDLTVYDSNDLSIDPFYSGTFTVYPTGLTKEEVVYPEYVPAEDSQVLVQNDQVSFLYENDGFDDFQGYTLNVYLENKTDLNLMYALEEVTVNGTACDPYWATTLPPHTRGCAQIAFFDLESYGITGEVSDVSFRLSIYDSKDWSADPLVDESFTIHP